mgnify:CR=1 FL=1
MKPIHVIGFRCKAQRGDYPCNLTVSFPANSGVSKAQINQACDNALNEAAKLHGGVKVLSHHEKIIMVKWNEKA